MTPETNCYENTLVIVRLLTRLYNADQALPYARLRQDFKAIGYHQIAVDAAFEKVSKFGLIASSEGYRMDNWNDETAIGATTATRTYIDVLIGELGYLQYVSEDVPMPQEFVVSIQEKYGGTLIGSGSRNPRLQSISRFVDFIESEEKMEREMILKKRHFRESTFLDRFGIKSGGTHLWLTAYLRQFMQKSLQRAGATS